MEEAQALHEPHLLRSEQTTQLHLGRMMRYVPAADNASISSRVPGPAPTMLLLRITQPPNEAQIACSLLLTLADCTDYSGFHEKVGL